MMSSKISEGARSANVKVALLVNFIPPYRIPVFKALSSLVGDLRVFVSTPMETGWGWRPEWDGLDVQVQKTASLDRLWHHPAGFSERSALHIPVSTLTDLLRYRPDVVISGELGTRTIMSALYRLLVQPSRLIIWATLSERTEERWGRGREMLRSLLVRGCDGVIVNGASGGRYISGFGIESERLHIVSQVSETRSCMARDDEGKRLTLLQVGRIVELKGLRELIPALRRVANRNPDRGIDYVVVGDGPLLSVLESEQFPQNVRLKLVGNVPYEKLGAWYSQADLLVFPTLADEWGLVVNEAMAAGVPVLGSRYSQAVEELVEDGVNGWVFAPDDPDDFDAALQRAMETPRPVLREMGEAARRSVAHLTPQWAAERIADVIESVLQK